jgi:hypothetical protein
MICNGRHESSEFKTCSIGEVTGNDEGEDAYITQEMPALLRRPIRPVKRGQSCSRKDALQRLSISDPFCWAVLSLEGRQATDSL